MRDSGESLIPVEDQHRCRSQCLKAHLPLAAQQRLEVWVLSQDNFMYFKRPAIAYELEIAVGDVGEVAGAGLALSSHYCDTAHTWRSLLTDRVAS